MRITLNLASRPFADIGPAIKRLRIAMAALAVLSIGLGIGLHLVHHSAELARARDHSLDGQIAGITREQQRYVDMMHQPDNARLLGQVNSLNAIFDEKLFSWTLAMEDLETVLPGGVQVSSLEPVFKDGVVTLHLRVIGPRDREVALVANLEHSRRFLSPRIVNESAESSEGQNNRALEPVSASNRFNFDLLAEYNPATMSELAETHKAKPAAEEAHPEGSPAATNRAHPLPRGSAPQPLAPSPRSGRPPYNGSQKPAPTRPAHPISPPGGPR